MESVPSCLFAALLRVCLQLCCLCTGCGGEAALASAFMLVSYGPLARISEPSVVRVQEVSSVDGSRHNSIYNPSSRSGTAHTAVQPCLRAGVDTSASFCIDRSRIGELRDDSNVVLGEV